MGRFYLHRGNRLVSVGFCPDGDEPLQAINGLEYGLGDPPPHIRPEVVEQETTHADRRRREYPTAGEQLDTLWKLLGPSLPPNSEARAMYDKILEVKNKYPKPPNSR